jgi:hypothetical protein
MRKLMDLILNSVDRILRERWEKWVRDIDV